MEKNKDNITQLPQQNAAPAGLFKDLDLEVLGETFDVKPILAILALPDKEFALMQEVMLSQMEKQLNNVQDKLLMVQAFNASGLNIEDLNSVFDDMIAGIQKEFEGKLTQHKIDFLKRFLGLLIQSINDTEGIAKRIIPVPIELEHTDAKIPVYAKAGDVGMDLYAVEDITIAPGQTMLIPTGVKVALPLGYELQVRPRSGLSLNTALRVANSPGTIDSGYRDEIGVIVTNTEQPIVDMTYKFDETGRPQITSILHGKEYTINKGMRFAQLVLNEVPACAFYEVDTVSGIGFDRASGFGGTGGM